MYYRLREREGGREKLNEIMFSERPELEKYWKYREKMDGERERERERAHLLSRPRIPHFAHSF